MNQSDHLLSLVNPLKQAGWPDASVNRRLIDGRIGTVGLFGDDAIRP